MQSIPPTWACLEGMITPSLGAPGARCYPSFHPSSSLCYPSFPTPFWVPSCSIVSRVRYQYPRVFIVLKSCWFRTNSNPGHEFSQLVDQHFYVCFLIHLFFFLKQKKLFIDQGLSKWELKALKTPSYSFIFILNSGNIFPAFSCVQGSLELVGHS